MTRWYVRQHTKHGGIHPPRTSLNRIGEPVCITTGRKLGAVTDDTVVMLDGQTAFMTADPELDIFWGAYLGTPDEITIAGRLRARLCHGPPRSSS